MTAIRTAIRRESTSETYDAVEYEEPVTGLTWDSAYAWWNAKEIAERNAPKLAAFLTDYAEENSENFWMPDDDVLDWAYSTFEFSQAIGNDGCDGEPPANYTDREVTKDIGHSDYYEDEDVIQQVVETYGQ